MSPQHDIVLFGATGFTGALTAEYLARNAPPATRLALAGRNQSKLKALSERLAKIDDSFAAVPLLEADAADPASLAAVAESTKVVISTVGPYALHGEPLVAACAAAGTDYVDLTGEPHFVDAMWLRYHEQAKANGARIVHACGFDSIPHDLGAYFTVQQLPESVPIKIEGFVSAGGMPSGGTFHSAVNGFASAREVLSTARERKARESRPADRRVRGVRSAVRHDSAAGGWIVPLPTIDPQIVLRSARALDRYGPDFSYGHYMAIKRLPVAAGLLGGVGTLFALSQVPPARKLLLKLRGPGEGPSPERRAKSWFRVRFVGEGGGERVVTEVTGGDPGYDETAKMLAESALCLAHDDLPATSGQVTTAVAMGDALIERLQRAGIAFRVVEGGRSGARVSEPVESPV